MLPCILAFPELSQIARPSPIVLEPTIGISRALLVSGAFFWKLKVRRVGGLPTIGSLIGPRIGLVARLIGGEVLFTFLRYKISGFKRSIIVT